MPGNLQGHPSSISIPTASSPSTGFAHHSTPHGISPAISQPGLSSSTGPLSSMEPSPRSRPGPSSGSALQERPSKRSRVRQACNRCKARKIKCGDLRPCENCTSLGLVCKDWRPGESAQSSGVGAAAHGYNSGSDHDGAHSHYSMDLPNRSRAPSDGHHSGSSYYRGAEQRSSVHFHHGQSSRSHLRSDGSEPPPPVWPNVPYERSTHTVAWPPKPDLTRHRYLAYPYDSLYRNEFGHLKALSLSSGLAWLSYLHEYHKLANEQFLDALWQVLEGDAHDTGNTQMFALESELFSPNALASLSQMTGIGGAIAHPPLGGVPGQGQGPMDYDWSLGGAGGSINVPHIYNNIGMSIQPNTEGINTRAPSSASHRPTVSPVAKVESRSNTTSPTPATTNLSSAVPSVVGGSHQPTAGPSKTSTSAGSAGGRPGAHEHDGKGDMGPPPTPGLAEPETRPTDLWAHMDSLIPPQHRRSLIHTFLSTTYVLWPTFLLSEFLATLKDSEKRKDPTFVCLVIACCAIAAREEAGSVKGGPAAEWGSHFGFFELYLDVRRFAPRSTDWASLNHIQALFYLSHYCFGASGPYGVHRAHYLMNGCVSKCFDVGLHRSAETYTDAFTASEIEARRRTLWAVYCGDKVSAAYGRPVLLRLSDIDVAEIDVDSPEYDERLPASNSFDQAYSLRAYHRATIRLFCVLERVIDKINLPACSSSAALERLMRKKPKRPRQSANHDDSCMADHDPIGFSEELELIDMFQTADTPTPTMTHQDDPMFHAHFERLRTTAAFIKIFIYRHLFCMANTNLSREPPRLDYRDEMVKWCRELLLSQRKMIRRGDLSDFGSVISWQLSQTGRGLIPAIYISARLTDPSQDPNGATVIKESKELLVLSYDLLRTLSARFTASHRQLQIMQQAFKRLDLSLKRRHGSSTAQSAQPGVGGDGEAWREDSRAGAAQGRGTGTATSGLDLIAGVAGAGGLDASVFEGGASNEDDEDEDDTEADREKKGWIHDLPLDRPVEKGAPHTVNAYIGWPHPPPAAATGSAAVTASTATSAGPIAAASVETTSSHGHDSARS